MRFVVAYFKLSGCTQRFLCRHFAQLCAMASGPRSARDGVFSFTMSSYQYTIVSIFINMFPLKVMESTARARPLTG